ncbi:ATP-binding protein [Beijerinckia mobilis]|uniref:ATP-binding protein n=1 Tax=Beijerinckia mobilis TaxID=231434 RepID=UPI0014706D9D|nr:ATP-binding protein [Beijerinckia mobilis]
MPLTPHVDLALMVLAVAIGFAVTYASITLFRASSEVERIQRPGWIFAASVVFVCGLVTTYCIFRLVYGIGVPSSIAIEILPLVFVSGTMTAWIGFTLVDRSRPLLGGAIIGLSIGAQHYLLTASLKFRAEMDWSPGFVVLSILAPVMLAALSMAILPKDRTEENRPGTSAKSSPFLSTSLLFSSLLLATGICGAHSFGMAALTCSAGPGLILADQDGRPTLIATALLLLLLLFCASLLIAISQSHRCKHMELEAEELRKSRDHLVRAQRIAQMGSVEQDLVTGAIELSDEIYRLFNLDKSKPASAFQSFVRCLSPEDGPQCSLPMRMPHFCGDAKCQNLRFAGADGTLRWLHYKTEFLYDETGRPLRWIATYADATRIHEAETQQKRLLEELNAAKEIAEAATEALLSLNEKLELRVMERTAELIQTQEDLLKKERLSTIGQLTATVAHELRNPLGAIKNTLFLLKEQSTARELKLERSITRMERSVDRCNRIITHLLEYSRIGALNYDERNFDQWIQTVLDELVIPPAIQVLCDFSAHDKDCTFDPERLRQVIVNLVENAIQAMSDQKNITGEKILRLSTRHHADGVLLVVNDNGPGISSENLTRVFDPLFSTKSFGTGLGLPAVKQIVEQHGGTIALTSRLGEGTTITIKIPRQKEELAA